MFGKASHYTVCGNIMPRSLSLSTYYTAASEDSDEDSSDEEEEEEESVGLLGKRKKPADTDKATPAKKARNGDSASTPQQNGECKENFNQLRRIIQRFTHRFN